jgi:hypothetical protein
MRVVRSRGALSGFLLLLLGIWGALIPFVGPYFNYAYSPNSAWTWTAGRFWLELLPGIAAAVAGLILMGTANRSVGVFAGWLASLAGAWFIVGPVLGRLWNGAEGAAGTPVGGTGRQVWEQIGFFSGLGAAILFLGALALGRFTVTSIRDLRAADKLGQVDRDREPEPATTPAPAVAATPATFRDNRVEERHVVAEPVAARTGASQSGMHSADTAASDTRSTDTRSIDSRSMDTGATDTRSVDAVRPTDEGTRPVESVRSETVRQETVGIPGAHSEEPRSQGSRGGGLMGRMRDRVQGDRGTGGGGSTRNDVLDDQQRS